jgi:hypothetical protein
MDWRHQREILTAGGNAYDMLLNLAVWVKESGGQVSFYRSRHELVFVFRNALRLVLGNDQTTSPESANAIVRALARARSWHEQIVAGARSALERLERFSVRLGGSVGNEMIGFDRNPKG